MSSLIDVMLYLAKQGIAFRGHNENLDSLNQGAFIILLIKLMFYCNYLSTILGYYKEMCHMVFSKFMPDLKNVYENKINHTSWKVQDEIIKISVDLIKEIIVEEIVVSGNFALMVDEARYNIFHHCNIYSSHIYLYFDQFHIF